MSAYDILVTHENDLCEVHKSYLKLFKLTTATFKKLVTDSRYTYSNFVTYLRALMTNW